MFRIIVFAVVGVLFVSCWLDKYQPEQSDTMQFKLKYVRLRPIHEEDRLRVQSRMTIQEYESMRIAMHKELAIVDID